MRKIISCLFLIISIMFLNFNESNALDSIEQLEYQVSNNRKNYNILKVSGENVSNEKLETEVLDTLSSKSTLLIVISMFDIALGIGIINYVKENKI